MNDTTEEVKRLKSQGVSERKIADYLGITRHAVRKAGQERALSPAVALQPDTSTKAYASTMASAMGRSGRVSRDSPKRKDTLFNNIAIFIDDNEVDGDNRYEWMDSDALRRKSVSELLEIAIASSPEVGRAVWDFLRASVPGWEIKVIDPKTEATHDEGQAIINTFRNRIARYHGTEEVLYTKMFMSILVRGSVMSEVYFEDDTRTPVDIAVPDPKSLRFRRVNNDERGDRWQVGQMQDEEFVPLEGETIRYVAHDPLPGKPYSRSPFAAAVFPAIFLLGIFQDLRRVIANQGWPRVDVSINVEAVQDMLADALNDDNIAENGTIIASVLESLVAQVEETIAGLKPGDWYVHSSLVEVKDAVGTMDVTSIGEITNVIEALERVAVKALKTMPLLQGIGEAAAENDANRQWEMWAAGVKALQHVVENSVQAHFDTVLQANGVNAKTIFRFAEIRAAEELRDAQTMMMKLDNAIKAEQAGYMEGDEAAEHSVGHPIPDSIREDRESLLGKDVITTDKEQWADMDSDGNESTNANMATQAYRGQRDTAMLPVVPEKVTVNALDASAAIGEFDDLAEEWAGILEAEIVEDAAGDNG